MKVALMKILIIFSMLISIVILISVINTKSGALFLLIIAFLFAMVIFYNTIDLFLLSRKERAELAYSFPGSRKLNLMHLELTLIKGEKIIIPEDRCYFQTSRFKGSLGKLIVTNKRIVLGSAIFAITFWHPMVESDKNAGMGKPFENSRKIKNINWEGEDMGIKLEVDPVVFARTYAIYHPKAREIYEIFSQPSK